MRVTKQEVIFDGVTATTTSSAVRIGSSLGTFALAGITMTGTSPNVTMTYELCDTESGTFKKPTGATDIFTAETSFTDDTGAFDIDGNLNSWIKFVLTLNSGTLTGFSCKFAFQEERDR
jgi:hypothetical protein